MKCNFVKYLHCSSYAKNERTFRGRLPNRGFSGADSIVTADGKSIVLMLKDGSLHEFRKDV